MIGSYSTKERFPVEKKNTSKFNVWAAVHSYGQFAGSIVYFQKNCLGDNFMYVDA
jgi:hypothetical protein